MNYNKIPLEQFQIEAGEYQDCRLILNDPIMPLRFQMTVESVVFVPYISRTMTLRSKNIVVNLDFVKKIKKNRLTNGAVSYKIYFDNDMFAPHLVACVAELVCTVRQK